MFGLFKKSEPEPALLTWSKQIAKDNSKITDKEKAFARKLISYAANVFLQKNVNRLNLKTVKSDVTIIELAVFFLYLVDYALFAKETQNRDRLMDKIIGEYENILSANLPGIDSTQFINSRLNLYGEQTRSGQGSVISSSAKLLHSLINSSNQLIGFHYYKSKSKLLVEYDPLYNATITELTYPYIQSLSPTIEGEIDQLIKG